MQQLDRAFGGAKFPARQTQIGIDHADERQMRKMPAFGDELGADNQVNRPVFDRMGGGGGGVRAGDGVAGHDQAAGFGEDQGGFLGDALDAGPDRGQAVLGRTVRTLGRDRDGVAAMVAQKLGAGAVLDQPGGAIGALHAVAATAAQRQGGVAAAVEEQHRLLPTFQRLPNGLD